MGSGVLCVFAVDEGFEVGGGGVVVGGLGVLVAVGVVEGVHSNQLC